jgi:hypothetical protein
MHSVIDSTNFQDLESHSNLNFSDLIKKKDPEIAELSIPA